MEETVTISLKRFKELELIESALTEKKTVWEYKVGGYSCYHLLSEMETIVRLAEINTELKKEVQDLYTEKHSNRKRGWFR